MMVCRWLVGFGGLERICCGPGNAIPLLLRDRAGDDSFADAPGAPPFCPVPSLPPPRTGKYTTPLASLSLIVPLNARDAGNRLRVSENDNSRMTTIISSWAMADRNNPRIGNPWLTSRKLSTGGADPSCISLIRETSIGFSTFGGGVISGLDPWSLRP